MIATLSYNLTEYTDFRKLEFQYSKTKDENAELKERLNTIENAYRETIECFQKQKIEWYKTQAKLKAVALDSQEQINELILFFKNIHEEIKNFTKMGIDLGIDLEDKDFQGNFEQIQQTKWIINQMTKCLMMTLNKNNDLALKYERQSGLFKSQSREYKRREKDLKQQISYLSQEISKFENTNTSLMNEINILKRQNMDFKLQMYQLNKISKEESIVQAEKDDHIQDNNFALDLLNYEKELLERVFSKLLSSIKNESINQILVDIYASYESVAEAYRQKLQIQYDLEDLERQYKRQKNSKVNEHLLIELRKQIQDFRNQLHKQKLLLNNQEQNLQRLFDDLENVDRQQKKIRNYTIQIQKKLKEIKSYNQTKRNSDDSIEQRSSRIQFKATTKGEDVMKEMLRRDRENIEKIFKQTRSNYHKSNNI